MEKAKFGYDIIVAILYFAMLIFATIQASKIWRNTGIRWKSLTTMFYINFILFLLTRFTWQVCGNVIGLADDEVSIFIINRIAFIFFLFAYNNTLFYWIDTVESTINLSYAIQAARGELSYRFMSTRTRIALWGTTALLIVFTIICIVLYIHSGEEYNSVLYRINILFIATAFLLFSIGYLVYGLKIYFRIRKSITLKDKNIQKNQNPYGITSVFLLQITPVATFMCFLYRFVLFFYSAVYERLPYGFYLTGYYIPELVPSAFFLYILSKRGSTNQPTPLQPVLNEESPLVN